MPTYIFRNTNTDEQTTRIMKISDREQFLADNPHIVPVLTAPTMIDPVRLGVRRHDNGFKEVLQKVHEKTVGSALNKTTTI